MVNGKNKHLQDGKSSVFLCENETFWGLKIVRPRFELQNGFSRNSRLRDIQNHSKDETTQDPYNFTKILRDLYIFRGHSPPLCFEFSGLLFFFLILHFMF